MTAIRTNIHVTAKPGGAAHLYRIERSALFSRQHTAFF
jgi:hypothetical protein